MLWHGVCGYRVLAVPREIARGGKFRDVKPPNCQLSVQTAKFTNNPPWMDLNI